MDVQKLMDVYEVQNIASAYVHNLNSRKKKEIVYECFTQHTPGQKVQITDWGVWEGEKAAERLFLGFMNDNAPEKPVTMGRHELTSPYIIVAEDSRTAVGVWDAPGWETAHYYDHWIGGDFTSDTLAAWWSWGAYWMAFQKEPEGWRIWQLKFLSAINCDMLSSYVKSNSSPRERVNWDLRPKETWPDRPGYDWIYHPEGTPMPDRMPLPKPYKTWTDDMSQI